jgi:hypothetical protein
MRLVLPSTQEVSQMSTPNVLAVSLTALFLLGVILYRLAWAGSSIASASAQGRLPMLPKQFRNWLLGERNKTTA